MVNAIERLLEKNSRAGHSLEKLVLVEDDDIIAIWRLGVHIVPELTRLEEISPQTQEHTMRVIRLAMSTAKTLGLDDEMVKMCGLAAGIHDVGKVYVDPNLLNTNRRLNEEEKRGIRNGHMTNLLRTLNYNRQRIVEKLGLPQYELLVKATMSHHDMFPAFGSDEELTTYPRGFFADIDRKRSQMLAEEYIVSIILLIADRTDRTFYGWNNNNQPEKISIHQINSSVAEGYMPHYHRPNEQQRLLNHIAEVEFAVGKKIKEQSKESNRSNENSRLPSRRSRRHNS